MKEKEHSQRQEELLRLRLENQQLKMVVDGTNAGYWDWNIQTGKLTINERWANITGYTLDELSPVTIDTWIRLCHPDDLQRSNNLLEKHFVGKSGYYECEIRMLHKNGSWVWILDRGKVFEWDGQGKPLRMVGSHQDITVKKKAEENLKRERMLFISGPVCIFRWQNTPGWPVEYVSPNIEQLLGYSSSDMLNGAITYSSIIHPEDRQRVTDEVTLFSDGKRTSFEQEYRLVTAAGNTIWVYDHTVIHRNDYGEITHYEGYILNYSSRKKSVGYLKDRLEFEHLIATITNRLINLAADQIDPVIDDILMYIGKYAEADRCYIFEFYDNNNLMDNTHEWCADGIHPEIDTLKELSTSSFPWWMKKVRNNEVIHIPDIAQLPPEAKNEKKTLEAQRIKSLIAIPLTSKNNAFGFIGFDAVRKHHSWHPETISILQLAGGVISNALMRKQVEQLLESELDLALKLSASTSLKKTLSLCLETAISISGMDCGGIYLVNPSDYSLSLSVHKGLPKTFLEFAQSYPAGNPKQQLVMKGLPVYGRYSQLDIPDKKLARTKSLQAIAILPVTFNGDVIACLNIASYRLENVPEFTKKALETITSHVGAAIMRSRHEDEIVKTKKNLENLFNTIDDYLFILDKEGKVIHTNDTVLYNLNYSPDEISRSHVLDFHPPCNHEQVKETLQEMFSGKADLCMIPLQTREGRLIPVETKVNIGIWNNQFALFGISRDITERLLAEKKLRESEKRFRELTDLLPQPVFECNLDSLLTYANKTALQVFGFIHDAVGKNFFDLCPPEQHRALQQNQEKLIAGNHIECHEFVALTETGKTFPAILYSTLITDNNRINGFRYVLFDLTKHKEIEETRRESELKKRAIQQYRNLLHNIPGIVYTTDKKGQLDFLLSPKVESITGYSANEIMAMQDGWLSIIHPDEQEEFKKACKNIRQNPKPVILNYRIRTKTGKEKWIEDRKSPLLTVDEKCNGADGIIFDITERVFAESEKHELEIQLLQSQRLETIGTLAGGIAHDFNNILTPVIGYSEMLEQLVKPDETLTDYVREISKASQRAKNLVEQILAFSRINESRKTQLNLATIINEALKLIRPSIPSTIAITIDIDNNIGNVFADASQLHQVIINLCTNAYQAMGENGGKLSMQLRSVYPSWKLLKSHPSLRYQPYAKLKVCDTGTGMNKKTIERIFEPFFTTKPVNKGTGLGLSVAHGIITKHSGIITVTSKPGKGSAFSVYLPLINKQQALEHRDKESILEINKSCSILFVDDEIATVKMIKTMLEKNGHSVMGTTSTTEALDMLRRHPNSFDLLITDLTMPEMTGIVLAEKTHIIKPGLPVILMTGHGSDHESLENLNHCEIEKMLRKPVSFFILQKAIQEIIQQKNHD